MSFYYISYCDQKLPLWDYNIIEEVSDSSESVKYRFILPAQLAITPSGLAYITNQKDGKIVVLDCETFTLKVSHTLNLTCTTRGGTAWMEQPTSISSDGVQSSAYIIPKSKPLENKKLCIMTSQDNGKFIKVSSANLGSWNAYSVCGGPDGNIYLGNSREESVYTYSVKRGFLKTLNVDCNPSCLAYDYKLQKIHVCDSYANRIKVFDKDGSFDFEYGKSKLVLPQQVAIGNNSFSYVACCFNMRCHLVVFNSCGEYMYSVHGFTSLGGVGVGPDGAVWVSDPKANHVVKFNNLSSIKPPFCLSLLSYRKTLLHLNEMEITSIPDKFSNMFTKWSQIVKINLRQGEEATPTVFTLRLKHGIKTDVVKWIICERFKISEKVLMIFREMEGGQHIQQVMYYMDHLIVDQLATPTSPPPPLVPSKSSPFKQ